MHARHEVGSCTLLLLLLLLVAMMAQEYNTHQTDRGVPMPSPPFLLQQAGGDACPIALVPQWVFTMGILVLLTLFIVGAGTCIACCSRMRARAAARKYAGDKSRKSSIGGNGSGRSSDIEMRYCCSPFHHATLVSSWGFDH